MRSLSEIKELVEYYKGELEKRGRVFKPIKVDIFSRKTYNSYGKAYHYTKRPYDLIVINQWIKNDDDLINTILHELAHLDKEAVLAKHGPAWKRVAALYSRWFNTKISRTGYTELTISRDETWLKLDYTDKALKKHKKLTSVARFANAKKAENYILFTKANGFITGHEYISQEEAREELKKYEKKRK